MKTSVEQESLKIALVQTSLEWENSSLNRSALDVKIADCSDDLDVIILPEMFTTGFTMTPENIGEEEGKNTLEWMKRKALEKEVALVGSIVFEDSKNFYNRLFFVKPDGAYFSYDKRHTFTLAGESNKYKHGTERLILDYKGFRFCPLICYDLRFPVWSRNTVDYDILIYVANWPAPRISAWDTLLKARAIENMSYAIGVNRIGTDKEGHEYPGHSGVYDPLGKQLIISKEEEILEVKVTRKAIVNSRRKLRFLEDRDQFKINF